MPIVTVSAIAPSPKRVLRLNVMLAHPFRAISIRTSDPKRERLAEPRFLQRVTSMRRKPYRLNAKALLKTDRFVVHCPQNPVVTPKGRLPRVHANDLEVRGGQQTN